MAFQVSPGINVSEVDLTSSIPAVSVSTGAIAGNFNWGPVEQIVRVSSEVDLVNKFGSPDSDTANVFFTAASFLAYSNDLLVVRTTGTNQKNAVANANTETNATAVLVKNEEDYFNDKYNGGTAGNVAFIAKYPGALGNSLKISICPSESSFSTWAWAGNFQSAPNTSPYVYSKSSNTAAHDEMHIVVIDSKGLITGTANTLLERFSHVSKASDARNDDGSTNYYKEVLFKNSKYVYWANTTLANTTNTMNWGSDSLTVHALTGGSNVYGASGNNYTVEFNSGADGSTSNVNNAYDKFIDVETIDVSLLIGADASGTQARHIVQNIAEVRKDCVAFISPPLANVQTGADSVKSWRDGDLNVSSSYAIMDSGWKYMYDKYNDLYRWVPLNGDIAGLCARTDLNRDPWFSPAGYDRGQIKNVVKLALNPNKTDRDTLYKAGINPVVSFPGEGTVLYGDKTLLSRASAFDRINVRRLFIVLEKAIARAAKASLFEFNDEFTRAQFVSLVEPFLRTIQGRRGIYDFRVVCDETNNTPDIIDQNQFVGDIYIKPARSVNFIQLNFVAVRTGVAFDEVVGKF